jgi:ATP:ADP antiporter, AAA family
MNAALMIAALHAVRGREVHFAKYPVEESVKCWRATAPHRYAQPMETLIKKLVNFKSGEGKALLWSFAYFFFLMSAYYMLLPIRDAFGIRGGAQDLPWLFFGTFIAALLTAPLQASIAAKLPRQRFVPVTYLFLVANMLIFWFLLKTEIAPDIVSKAFFIWITVFSVFTVSIFWTFMSDLYSSAQGSRLFGFVAAGGSLGSILGPQINKLLVGPLGIANLLLLASALLICAIVCANRLEPAAAQLQSADPDFVAASAGRDKKPVGGGVFDGFGLLFKSSYLGGIGLWVFMLSLLGTFLYLTQANIVASYTPDMKERTSIFSTIYMWVGILSAVVQLLGTGRIIKAVGTGATLAILPLVFVVGFSGLMFTSALFAVAAFQACQRAANFGISNVARESLWPVVSREEKFKAKNIVDGAVFRGADFVNAFIYTGLAKILSVQPTLAAIAVVLSGGWAALSFGLGRAREKRAREQAR